MTMIPPRSILVDARERSCWFALTYPILARKWRQRLASSSNARTVPTPCGRALLLGRINTGVKTQWLDAWIPVEDRLREPSEELPADMPLAQMCSPADGARCIKGKRRRGQDSGGIMLSGGCIMLSAASCSLAGAVCCAVLPRKQIINVNAGSLLHFSALKGVLASFGFVLATMFSLWLRRSVKGCKQLLPSSWAGLVELDEGMDEWKTLAQAFKTDCAEWQEPVPFSLEILKIYLVQASKPDKDYQVKFPGAQKTERLYHGTSKSAAKAIVEGGFTLPRFATRLGRGIYFTSAPLKAWQYATKAKSSYVIVSDIALGCSKLSREINPIKEFGAPSIHAIADTLQQQGYDSVVGLTSRDGGVLSLPECCIYNPERAAPRYVLEVAQIPVRSV